jgi:hypothetical protein
MRLLFSVLGTLAVALCLSQVPPGTILTSERVLVVGEPRAVAGQDVVQLSSSPSGRYLVVVRETPSAQSVLVPPPKQYGRAAAIDLWDSQTGELRELASFERLGKIALVVGYSPTQRGEQYMDRARIDWLAGVDKAIVSVTIVKSGPLEVPGSLETVDQFYTDSFFLDAQRGTLRRIYSEESEGGHHFRIVPSPTLPLAVKCVVENGRNGITLQTLSSDGSWGAATRTSKNVFSSDQAAWSPDGTSFQVEVTALPEGATRNAKLVLIYLPGKDGYELVPGPLGQYQAPSSMRDVTLVKEALAEGEPYANLPSRWTLQTDGSEMSAFIVSVGAQMAYLPNGERFVAYIVDGVLFTRLIREVSRSQLQAWQDAELKADAIRRAERLASAVWFFARDNNGEIPSSLDIQSGALDRVLIRVEDLKGFRYACTAKNMNEVRNRATTVLGYIETTVGRAVIYLDQSVKWEPQTGGG